MGLHLAGILQGLQLAGDGVAASLKNSSVRNWILVSFLVLSCATFLLHEMLQAVLFYPAALFDVSTKELMSSLQGSLINVPFFLLLLIRYVYTSPLDSIFMATLQWHSPLYFVYLSRYSYKVDYWRETQDFLRRTSKRAGLGMVLFALSRFDWMGRFVLPVFSFSITARPLGRRVSVLLAIIVMLVPLLQPHLTRFLSELYGCRALGRELLQSFLVRIELYGKKRRRWFADHQSTLLGFSLPFYLLMKLPYIGAWFFVIAQAAIVVLLVNTTDYPEKEAERGS